MPLGDEELAIVAKLVDQTKRPLDDIQRRLKQTETVAKKRAAGMSRAFTKVGQVLSTRVVASVGALGAAFASMRGISIATQNAIEFGEAMTEVATIVDTSRVSMGEMSKAVMDIASANGVARAEVSRGLYQAISGGAEAGAEATELLRVATEFAVAGFNEVVPSVKLLNATLNAYRGTALTAQEVTDVLFKTVELGVTNVNELSSSMGRVLPVAAALGIRLEEVAAVVATLTKGGMDTAAAITSLRGILNTLSRPSEEAKRVIAALGLDMSLATVRADGLAGVFKEVAAAAREDENAVASLFTEVEARVGVLSILADEGQLLSEQLRGIEDAAGTVGDALDKRLSSPAFRAKQVWVDFSDAMGEVGDVLLSLGFGVVDITSELVDMATAVEKVEVTVPTVEEEFRFLLSIGGDIATAWERAETNVALFNERLGETQTAVDALDFSNLVPVPGGLDAMVRQALGLDQLGGPDAVVPEPPPSSADADASEVGALPTVAELPQQRGPGPFGFPRAPGSGSQPPFFSGPNFDSPIGPSPGMSPDQRDALADSPFPGVPNITALDALQKKIDDMKGKFAGLFSALRGGARDFSSAILDWANKTKTASEAFSDFATSFLSRIARMIVEALFLRAIMAGIGLFSAPLAQAFGQATGLVGPVNAAGTDAVGSSLVSPATASGGGGSVNINATFYAVDSQSFIQAAARDPRGLAEVTLSGIASNPRVKQAFQIAGVPS